MPKVAGRKFPYTKVGMKQASKARKKTGPGSGNPLKKRMAKKRK
tara:strand:+ start:770 stop:901 length:132 start_codon:yes stop_codon:yes gene_type:complete